MPIARNFKPRQSCDICRKRKVKCDNVGSRCSNCLSHGVPCTFTHFEKSINKNPTQPNSKDIQTIQLNISNLFSYENHPKQENIIIKAPNLSRKEDKIDPNEKILSLKNPKSKKIGLKLYIGGSPASFMMLSDPVLFLVLGGDRITPWESVFYNQKLPNQQDPPSPDTVPDSMILTLSRLYFSYSNQYSPILDDSSYYKRLETDTSASFMALTSAICLVGVGYYPAKTLLPTLTKTFASRFHYWLKKCYMKPSITLIQALLLQSLFQSQGDGDGLVQHGWYYFQMAAHVAKMLGLHKKKIAQLTPYQIKERRQVWTVLYLADRLHHHCIGKPSLISRETSNFSLCQLTLGSPVSDSYANEFGIYCGFLEAFDRISLRYSHLTLENAPLYIIGPKGHKGHPDSTIFSQKLEQLQGFLSTWYCKLPSKLLRQSQDWSLALPNYRNFYSCLINVAFLSLTIELNHLLCTSNYEFDQAIKEALTRGKLPMSEFNRLNHFNKSLLCAYYIASIFRNTSSSFLYHGCSYKWVCGMRAAAFILRVLLATQGPDENSHKQVRDICKTSLDSILSKFQEGGKRWLIAKDMSMMFDQVIQGYFIKLS